VRAMRFCSVRGVQRKMGHLPAFTEKTSFCRQPRGSQAEGRRMQSLQQAAHAQVVRRMCAFSSLLPSSEEEEKSIQRVRRWCERMRRVLPSHLDP